MNNITGQLFGQGVKRAQGKQSRRYNLLAARLIADLVKNLLGPRGMEKMFIDILGEVTVTKDGAMLLRKIDVEHPAAKVLIEASNTLDNEVGDGTTSVVVFAGALVERAEELLDMGIAPTTIIEGYLAGLEICLECLRNIASRFTNYNREMIQGLASTCLRPKMISYTTFEENMAAELVVDAVYAVADFANRRIEADNIKIEEKTGNTSDTRVVKGVVIDKTIDNPAMPRSLENARILLIDEELESKRTRTDAEINITSPYQIRSYLDKEVLSTSLKVQRIIDSGATVLISQKGINASAQNYLSKAGIISIRRVRENDMDWLKKATNAEVIRDLSSNVIRPECLGFAESVYEKFVGGDKMVFVEGCKNPRSVTILLRAGSKRLLDEYHRSILDAIAVIRNFIVEPSIVGGGGSTEMLIATCVRKKAISIRGRRQIVLQKFASALEEIPLTLARNAGMDTVDTIAQLRSRQKQHSISTSNRKIVRWIGIDAVERKVAEIYSQNVIEPSIVKEQIFKTAVEVTTLLIRVDDVLMAKPAMYTHTHANGIQHSHAGGEGKHDHHFDKLGKRQRPAHHFY
ncbi:MAG TPA: thermosome subunit alpha [Candidatus Nitrosopolaris sp.]|nr:thermosome subunit alpha [Candidatus Nitrosopolaris sp.]